MSAHTALIMAGGTGGHIYGFGRALRLTPAMPALAYAENMPQLFLVRLWP